MLTVVHGIISKVMVRFDNWEGGCQEVLGVRNILRLTHRITLHYHCRSYVFIAFFYRATLCISAVLAVGRCPSAGSSVTFVNWN